jgi:hypothetical protein
LICINTADDARKHEIAEALKSTSLKDKEDENAV